MLTVLGGGHRFDHQMLTEKRITEALYVAVCESSPINILYPL